MNKQKRCLFKVKVMVSSVLGFGYSLFSMHFPQIRPLLFIYFKLTPFYLKIFINLGFNPNKNLSRFFKLMLKAYHSDC